MKKLEMTTAVCPTCGTELALVALNGKTENEVANKTQAVKKTAVQRIEELKKAGIDVDNKYFAIAGSQGGDMLVRLSEGVLTTVDDDDPVFKTIDKYGDIPERRLFRRWVMKQMLDILEKTSTTICVNGRMKKKCFNDVLRDKGYEYCWKMVLNEMNDQRKMYDNDKENYLQRNMFFNRTVITEMCCDYMKELRAVVKKRCKRNDVLINSFVIDGKRFTSNRVESALFAPLEDCINRIRRTRTPLGLYAALVMFCEQRVKMDYDTPLSKTFIDAYKGSGSFYTMQNMIRFHNIRFFSGNEKLSKSASLKDLSNYASLFCSEGWKLLGILKELMDKNNFDIAAKKAEWVANKRK